MPLSVNAYGLLDQPQLSPIPTTPSLQRRHLAAEGIPKSWQIFRASKSLISLCLGTADLLLLEEFDHHECLAPSRS